jgi:aspartyl-tRNA(Asn)/glutamyl-tRNA(Gln) amidotransferase subunit C
VEKLTRENILHIAKLSHLEIKEEEIATRLSEFNDILAYIEKLNALPTQGIEPSSQIVAGGETLGTPMAPDEPAPDRTLTPNAALQNAPARQDHFFMVPRMIGEEG